MIKLRVKQILENQGKTAYWLAKTTGISTNNVSNICNGTSSIRLDTIEKICLALECTPNDIFETDNKKMLELMKKE